MAWKIELHETKKRLRKLARRGSSCVSISTNPFFEFFLWVGTDMNNPIKELNQPGDYIFFFAYEYKKLIGAEHELIVDFKIIEKGKSKNEAQEEITKFDDIHGNDEEITQIPDENYCQKIISKKDKPTTREIIASCRYGKHFCPPLKVHI